MLGAVLGSLFASQQPQNNSGETPNTGGLLSSILGSILSQGSEKTNNTAIGANILSHIISGAISNGQNPYDTTPVESPDGQPVTPIAPTTIGPTSTFRTGYEDILNDWAERFKKSEEKQNETKIETEPEKKREKRSRTLKDRRGDRRRAKAKESRDRDKRDKKERSDRMKRNRDNAVRKERNKRRRSGSKSGGVL